MSQKTNAVQPQEKKQSLAELREAYFAQNKKAMKKENKGGSSANKKNFRYLMYLLIPVLIAAFAIIYIVFINGKNVKAQSEDKDSNSPKILAEFNSEQQLLEQEKRRLEDYERNLKSYEAELDRKLNDYLNKVKDQQTREDEFNKKVEALKADRQIIETYENIDPEQAAVLIKRLYEKDSTLATLIMRKITSKKAGKILEALIPMDKETSAQLAKDVMEYYKTKKE